MLLENDSDVLLLEVAAALGEASGTSKLKEALEYKWLMPTGCGGTGELQKRVEGAIGAGRIAVVIDSDRRALGAEPSKKSSDIIAACTARHVPFHCLCGHERENYIPKKVIGDVGESWPNRRAKATKAPLAFGGVLRWLQQNRKGLDKKHGQPAVDEVAAVLKRHADKPLTRRTIREQLAEFLNQTPAEQMVDDLKERLGERFLADAERVLRERLTSDPGTVGLLEAAQADDLKKMAEKVVSVL